MTCTNPGINKPFLTKHAVPVFAMQKLKLEPSRLGYQFKAIFLPFLWVVQHNSPDAIFLGTDSEAFISFFSLTQKSAA